MVDLDILYEKSGIIQRCLKRIQDVTRLDASILEDDINVQDVFVLNLQRAIQAAIDLAAHIISSEGLGLPDSLKSHFTLLKSAGILSHELTKKMEAMVGFRNIAIHEYEKINVDILKSILMNNLQDLEVFYQTVLNYYSLK